MKPEDLNDLAHEIAEDDCKSVIECNTLTERDASGKEWRNIKTSVDPGHWFVKRAVRYLDAAKILKRSPTNRNFVGWDEDGL